VPVPVQMLQVEKIPVCGTTSQSAASLPVREVGGRRRKNAIARKFNRVIVVGSRGLNDVKYGKNRRFLGNVTVGRRGGNVNIYIYPVGTDMGLSNQFETMSVSSDSYSRGGVSFTIFLKEGGVKEYKLTFGDELKKKNK
jgi:hypothetical protein